MNDLRVQIVNFKTKRYLIDCLTSLSDDLKSFPCSFSVTILDNASGDDLSDIPITFPSLGGIEIIQGKNNLGFGSGHNLLARHAEAKYLLLLNPDTKMIESRTTERLLSHIQDSQADVVGPRLVTPQNVTQRYDHGELKGVRAWISLRSGNSYWRERAVPTKVAWVSGAVFLVRKNCFDKLGGFDENFFLYKEEEELCWRLRASSGTVVYDPTISVLHYGSVVAKKSEHMRASVDYFLDKHFKNRFGYRFWKLLNKLIHQTPARQHGYD